MSKLHKLQRNSFLVCGTEYLFDPELSLAGRGLLSTILSLSEGSALNFRSLSALNNEKKKVYERTWDELIQLGYITSSKSGIIARDYRD